MASSYLNIPGLPLGLRNNNPGNLRPLNGQKWLGELSPDTVHNFSRFENVAYGLRAMITDLVGDIVQDGNNTIRKLVYQYAPASENNTQAYIESVSQAMGTGPDMPLQATRDTIERLIRAQLSVELGAKYAAYISPADLSEAFSLISENTKSWIRAGGSILSLILVGFLGWMLYKRGR